LYNSFFYSFREAEVLAVQHAEWEADFEKRENELKAKMSEIDIVYKEMIQSKHSLQIEREQFENDVEFLDKLKKEMTSAESDVTQIKIENESIKHRLLERAQQLESAHREMLSQQNDVERERANMNKRMERMQKDVHDKEISFTTQQEQLRQEKEEVANTKTCLDADRSKHDIAWKRLTVLEESIRNRETAAKKREDSIERKAVELESLAKSLQTKVLSLEFERDELNTKLSQIEQFPGRRLSGNNTEQNLESRLTVLENMSQELSRKEASLALRTQETKEMQNRIKKTVFALQKKDEQLAKTKKNYDERMKNCLKLENDLQLWQDELERAGSNASVRPKQ